MCVLPFKFCFNFLFQDLKDVLAFINPLDEKLFPGVTKIKEDFEEWQWKFGKTPKFSIDRDFTGHTFNENNCEIRISITVEKGKVSKLDLIEKSQVMDGITSLVQAFYQEHLVGEELTQTNLCNTRNNFMDFCDKAFLDRGSEVYKCSAWISYMIHSSLDFV